MYVHVCRRDMVYEAGNLKHLPTQLATASYTLILIHSRLDIHTLCTCYNNYSAVIITNKDIFQKYVVLR